MILNDTISAKRQILPPPPPRWSPDHVHKSMHSTFSAYHVDYNFYLDKIFGSDSKCLKHNDIQKFLAKSERLRGKPKLLFIQACQGVSPGAEAVADRLSDVATDDDRISEYTDFYLSCASVAGDRSYRDILTGER